LFISAVSTRFMRTVSPATAPARALHGNRDPGSEGDRRDQDQPADCHPQPGEGTRGCCQGRAHGPGGGYRDEGQDPERPPGRPRLLSGVA
jgi:hypothetical protein